MNRTLHFLVILGTWYICAALEALVSDPFFLTVLHTVFLSFGFYQQYFVLIRNGYDDAVPC